MPKAQVVVTDAIIALALLILTAIFLLVTLSYSKDKLEENIEFNDISEKAAAITDALAFSPGKPANWTLQVVSVPGLARWERHISYGKLVNFTNLTSDQVRNAFKIQSYLYRLVMYYHNSSPIVGTGYNYTGQFNISANARRAVMYGNQSAYLDFYIWR